MQGIEQVLVEAFVRGELCGGFCGGESLPDRGGACGAKCGGWGARESRENDGIKPDNS